MSMNRSAPAQSAPGWSSAGTIWLHRAPNVLASISVSVRSEDCSRWQAVPARLATAAPVRKLPRLIGWISGTFTISDFRTWRSEKVALGYRGEDARLLCSGAGAVWLMAPLYLA